MSRLPRLYRRLDERVRNLSRRNNALLMLLTTSLVYFSVGAVFGDASAAGALAMGLTMGVLYYAFDPR